MPKSKIEMKGMAKAIILLASFTLVVFILACAPPPRIETPISKWNNNYSFKFDLPETKPAVSVDATIAIVDPTYDKDTRVTHIDRSQGRSKVIGEGEFRRDETLLPVARGFARSTTVDMEKILVAKGMTVKGPYGDIEEITYPDKKGTDLTLTPTIYLAPKVIQEGEWVYNYGKVTRNITVEVSGWIAFVMREPLSNEKIWIKKLELDTVRASNIVTATAVLQKPEYVHVPGQIEYNGSGEAVADALSQMYPIIMNKFLTYINGDEILSLKAKSQEIRALKRY